MQITAEIAEAVSRILKTLDKATGDASYSGLSRHDFRVCGNRWSDSGWEIFRLEVRIPIKEG